MFWSPHSIGAGCVYAFSNMAELASPLETFKAFLKDKEAWEMFLTGRAGTGKTTTLAEFIEFLQEQHISYVVCAYTHKACEVLISKLPEKANVTTLHAFLKKCPCINQHATKATHIETSKQTTDPERVEVVLVDEYGMVGERDYADIAIYQDQSEDGTPTSKLVYIGDRYQLLPVKDMQALAPGGDYCVELTEVHRTECADLMDIATKLIGYIQGAPPEPLGESENFIRGKDIIKEYLGSESNSKMILAWTNKKVQELNFELAGKEFPTLGDDLWNSTMRHELKFIAERSASSVTELSAIREELTLGMKYKPLEFLRKQRNVTFIEVENLALEETQVIATVFGTKNYQERLKMLTDAAVTANKQIEMKTGMRAVMWVKLNPDAAMAKTRARAWRQLLTFKSAVMCVDFPFAMTIHKSQGSTYEEVYLDTVDLAKCAEFSFSNYARLFYVAVSRASKKVITT